MIDPRSAPLERKYRFTSRVYDLLDWPWERRYRKWRPELVGDLGGRVLEVGVGTGQNLRFYPPAVELHAVDLSEGMLSRARRRAENVACDVVLRRADALDLDHLADDSFDWYVATFLYCVLPDPLQPPALAEMARVLKPEGRFRLVEILYSRKTVRRWMQRVMAPYVELVFGARFDRRTMEHIEATPGIEITGTRWLQQDTYLLVEGRASSL